MADINDPPVVPSYYGNGIGDWFPQVPKESRTNASEWRLDVVTLLAVMGESSIAVHTQSITASMLCMLPRIIPAPQSMLKPSRPGRMPETPAKMAGIYSGVVLDSVGFFANIIQPLEDLKPFAFRAIEIRHKDENDDAGVMVPATPIQEVGRIRTWFQRAPTGAGAAGGGKGRNPGQPDRGGAAKKNEDIEKNPRKGTTATGHSVSFKVEGSPNANNGMPPQPLLRRRTMQEKATDFITDPTLAYSANKRPAIPVKLLSPVHVVGVFSFLLSLALVSMAAIWQDGPAVLAVSFLSVASSVAGYASWWQPILMNLNNRDNVLPPGDIVIRTREGAFVYVKCKEAVARELFAGTEECRYRVGERMYRFLMAISTVLLMLAVVLMGNCSWNMQVFIGTSYVTLNGVYWAMGMLPKRLIWDLGRYEWNDITPEDARNAEHSAVAPESGSPASRKEGTKSYTRTLWYAIRETKHTAWVKRSGAAPSTPQWNRWLAEAETAAREGNRNWPAQERKDKIMEVDTLDAFDAWTPAPGAPDRAEQHAPLIEVQTGRRDSEHPPIL